MYNLKLQDQVLRQKAKAKWLENRDINTAYFYSVNNGKRRRLCIQRIQDENGHWREGGADVSDAIVDYFQHISNHDEDASDFFDLNYILPKTSNKYNEM